MRRSGFAFPRNQQDTTENHVINQQDTPENHVINTNYDLEAEAKARDKPVRRKYDWLVDLVMGRNLNFVIGVVIPIFLNTFGVILFLRLGFIVGQAGLLVTICLYSLVYGAIFLTALSLNAIVSNGEKFKGGVYFMVSRTLGPEFGGTIAAMYYFGASFSSAMYVVGFTENLQTSYPIFVFASEYWSKVIISSCALFILFIISFIGMSLFSKATLITFLIVGISILHLIFSLSLSGVTKKGEGFNFGNFKENFLPSFTSGYNVSVIFGILYPSATGFLSGVSFSGSLSKPSRDIPLGVSVGNITTYFTYLLLAILFAFTISRDDLQENLGISTQISLVKEFMFVGISVSTLSASLVTLAGASIILKTISDDGLFPLTCLFKKQRIATIATYLCIQTIIFVGKLNAISPFVSVFYSCEWMFLNLACFLSALANSPNFRPTFRLYSKWTAFVGMCWCFGLMFFVNPLYAGLTLITISFCFTLIYFTGPAKDWGNLGQELIVSQLRKYNLQFSQRFNRHVKFWRPSVLCAVKHPIKQLPCIKFLNAICNHRGGICSLGIVHQKDLSANVAFHEREERVNYEFLKSVKLNVFTRKVYQPSVREGLLNLMISGLHHMTPNILCLGAFNENPSLENVSERFMVNASEKRVKIFDTTIEYYNVNEKQIFSINSYMNTIKEAILLGKNIIISRNFDAMNPENFMDAYSKVGKIKRWFSNFATLKHPKYLFKKRKFIDVIYYADLSFQQINQTLQLMVQLAYLTQTSHQTCPHHKLRILCLTANQDTLKGDLKLARNIASKVRIKAVIKPIIISEYFNKDLQTKDLNATTEMTNVSSFTDLRNLRDTSKISQNVPQIVIEEQKNPNDHTSKSIRVEFEDRESFIKVNISSNDSKPKDETHDRIQNDHNSQQDSGLLSKPKFTHSISFSLSKRLVSIGNFMLEKAPLELIIQDEDGNYLDMDSKLKLLNTIIKDQMENTSVLYIALPSFPEEFVSVEHHIQFNNWIHLLTQDLPPSLLVFGQEDFISYSL